MVIAMIFVQLDMPGMGVDGFYSSKSRRLRAVDCQDWYLFFRQNIQNLEEQAIKLVGTDVYEKLIKGYTAKQWRKDPKELPKEIITRLPVRFTYNNNYFNDTYQGIPIGGYTQIFEKLLDGIEVKLNVDYFENKEHWDSIGTNVIYTGPIDRFYD